MEENAQSKPVMTTPAEYPEREARTSGVAKGLQTFAATRDFSASETAKESSWQESATAGDEIL